MRRIGKIQLCVTDRESVPEGLSEAVRHYKSCTRQENKSFKYHANDSSIQRRQIKETEMD